MKQSLWLVLHFFCYQWRERLLLTLALAIFMGVGMLSAVNFFASSTQQAMNAQTSALLGADWIVDSTVPIPSEEWSIRAADLGLESTETVEFLTMAASSDHLQLAAIKAIDEAYPLRGQLKIRNTEGDYFTDNIPGSGEVWVDPRLLAALATQVGESLEIGAITLTIGGILLQEPDTGLAFLAMAPRILMNVADLPNTQVLDLGSRVEYRFLVSGEKSSVQQLAAELKPLLTAQQTVTDNMTTHPEVVQPVDQLLHFLTVSALIIFVLAATAMALATRTYAQRQTDSTAILRCLGATRRDMQIVYLSSLLLLSITASLFACVLGYALAQGLIYFAATHWQVLLPAPLIKETIVIALITGIVLVLGFAWPWLLNLQNVSPLRVLQRQLPAPRLATYWIYGGMVLAFSVIWSVYQTPLLTISMLFFVSIALVCFALMTYGLLRLLGLWGQRLPMPWRLGVLQMMHDQRSALMQLWVYSLVLTLAFFFILVRQDFIYAWKNKFPADAPNYFVINILPDQVTPLEQFFASQQQLIPTFYPMVRARVIKINDHIVSINDYPAGDVPNMIRRDLNLSFSDQLDNKTIAQGEAWDLSAYDRAQLSVEAKMAKDLGLKLGDQLSFLAGVVTFTGEIANIRDVDWYSMQPNFYVITTPGLIIDLPRTYLGSFYLPAAQEALLNDMITAFPNLTVLDVDAIIHSTRNVINQALIVIEVLFFMVMLASL
ncbi:MAG TPA: FtsX-like permease family protein, partial [Gammaproteobacteria bacterium]|nr:FtsX-like permease family protein [Gammaproteobacteria bacterium]